MFHLLPSSEANGKLTDCQLSKFKNFRENKTTLNKNEKKTLMQFDGKLYAFIDVRTWKDDILKEKSFISMDLKLLKYLKLLN